MVHRFKRQTSLMFLFFTVLFSTASGASAYAVESAPKPSALVEAFLSQPINKRLGFLNQLPFSESLKLMDDVDQYIRSLSHAAFTDPLTGLKNRRALLNLKQVTVEGNPLRKIAIISFDLDFFKKVNDTYGHAAGDDVLVEVARSAVADDTLNQIALRVQSSTRDLVFRKGGEEFEIVLLDSAVREAHIVAKRLRSAIQNITFEKYPELRVTASFGIAASVVSSMEMFLLLQEAADEAAYRAKSSGRNQVRVTSPHRLCELALSRSSK